MWVVPKRLRKAVEQADGSEVIRIGAQPSGTTNGDVDIQIRFTPSPEYAIVEVLFLWAFGPALQAILSPNVIGYRLDTRRSEISRTRRWLFEYWPKRYEEFRTVPVRVAMEELDQNASVVLLCADLSSFFDTIDPSYLLEESFIRQLEAIGQSGTVQAIDLAEYRQAVSSLLRSCRRFQQRAARITGIEWSTGIPIGALTSRLVANLALATMDSAIETRVGIRCYRRYVDDFVIVAEPRSEDVGDLDEVIQDYIPHVNKQEDTFRLSGRALDRSGSNFTIQRAKCRAYHLRGSAGQDFLTAVRQDFDRLVSARRAFLDPEVLSEDHMPSLVHAGPPERPLRVLREADRLRLEHFRVGTRHRALERVSALVDSASARVLASRAFEETSRFLVGDGDWVENLDVALRMLRIGVRAGDVSNVRTLLAYMDGLWGSTEQIGETAHRLYHRDREVGGIPAYRSLRDYLHARRTEAISSAVQRSMNTETAQEMFGPGVAEGTRLVGIRAFRRRATLLAAADLRLYDREDDAFGGTRYDVLPNDDEVGQEEGRPESAVVGYPVVRAAMRGVRR